MPTSLRGLPYPAAERLCSVRYAAPGADTPDGLERLNWASLADVIEHPIAWDLDMFYLVGGDHTEPAPGAWVTPDFVEGLGVRPALGRGLDASAFVAGSPQVALISHRLWQGRFGGNPNIIGQTFNAYVSDRPRGSRVVHDRRRAAGGLLAHQSVHRHPRAAARARRIPTWCGCGRGSRRPKRRRASRRWCARKRRGSLRSGTSSSPRRTTSMWRACVRS